MERNMDLDINQAVSFPLLCERTVQPYGEETGLFYLGRIPVFLGCWGAPSPEFRTLCSATNTEPWSDI